MDKLDKSISRLDEKEKEMVKFVLKKLQNDNLRGLNLQKLKSRKNIFRVKKGKIRIIYQIKDVKKYILAIERRSEKTYKNF